MATSSAPVFPYPGGVPGAEPADPVVNKPGHFAWSRWIKQYVKNLNSSLMMHEDKSLSVHGIADTAALVLTGDARLSDARTPTAHAASHAAAGSDPVTLAESQVTGLTAALALKAPLASPALTGVPTAPTAAQGTNTTQVATTAHVATEVGLLVPKALYDANTILKADTDNTPAALTVPASTLVGRGAAGGIAALSVADVRTLVGTTRVTRPLTTDLLIETYDATLGWVRSYYDSGWRLLDHTALGAPTGLTSGSTVRLRRINGVVHARSEIGTTAAWTGNGDANNRANLPAGFKPPSWLIEYVSTGRNGTTGTIVTFQITTNGIYPWQNIAASQSSGYSALTWMTDDAIPTSLPGTLVSAAPA